MSAQSIGRDLPPASAERENFHSDFPSGNWYDIESLLSSTSR
jgi:hypothetical protein